MNIQPNSEIRILKGVPLNNTYENTLFFDTTDEQTSYFKNKTKTGGIIPNGTYVRQSDGKIRMEQNPTFFYDCNYLMFKNTSFENKWFYAFITDVEYINNELSLVSFELDVMQTYHFNYTLKECFVERQHTRTDNIGSNTVAETVISDDFIYKRLANPFTSKALHEDKIVVVTTYDVDNNKDSTGAYYGGIYSGAFYLYFNGKDDFNVWYDKLVKANKKDSLIIAFMAPKGLVLNMNNPNEDKTKVTIGRVSYDETLSFIQHEDNGIWGTWKPKNNKLYTYPYSSLYVTNGAGDNKAYEYERFAGLPRFKTVGTVAYPPTAMLRPVGYRQSVGDDNYDDSLFIRGWSTVSYSNDAFTSWVANSTREFGSNLVGAMAVGGAVALGIVNPVVAGGIALSSTIANMVSGGLKANNRPNEYKGGNSGNHLYTSTGELTFKFYDRKVTLEKAKLIDDYFTRYGYAINKITSVSRKTRKAFTYVKTIGSNMFGDVPSSDMKKINSIFDNGITFWCDHINVGNYRVDNGAING